MSVKSEKHIETFGLSKQDAAVVSSLRSLFGCYWNKEHIYVESYKTNNIHCICIDAFCFNRIMGIFSFSNFSIENKILFQRLGSFGVFSWISALAYTRLGIEKNEAERIKELERQIEKAEREKDFVGFVSEFRKLQIQYYKDSVKYTWRQRYAMSTIEIIFIGISTLQAGFGDIFIEMLLGQNILSGGCECQQDRLRGETTGCAGPPLRASGYARADAANWQRLLTDSQNQTSACIIPAANIKERNRE